LKAQEKSDWAVGQNWDEKIQAAVAESRPHIAILGVGGAGCNIVSWIKDKGITGTRVIALNTDANHLTITKADTKILIGEKTCGGQGAGGFPEKGAEAMKETLPDVLREVNGSNLVFIATGMGGGTGTGASVALAEGLKNSGAVTIGVTTIPFAVERSRTQKAREWLTRLRSACDTVIVIDNNRLLKVAGNMPEKQAFGVANDLIGSFVKSVSDAISIPSLVNLDFADLKAVMERGGVSAIGVGEADGEDRAKRALRMALENQLLDTYNGIGHAKGALIQVIGGEDMTLQEINDAGQVAGEYLSPEAKMIWGAVVEPNYTGHIRTMVALTGVESAFLNPAKPVAPTATPPAPKKKGFFSI